MVAREASSTDRRIKHVVLTDAGNQLYDAVKAEASSLRKELLANLDPKKLAVATELLELLNSLLENAP